MAKYITVSRADLDKISQQTQTAEEVAAAMHAYKSVKLGTVQEEEAARREARAQADAVVAATHAANVEINKPIIATYDMLFDAIDQTVEEYEDKDEDACSDQVETFSRTFGTLKVSITEVLEGFEVDVNGKAMIVTDLSGRSIANLARAMK